MNKVYDLIVVGLGPASYTAGIYATRFNMNVLLIGREHGGLVAETPYIENYPGVDEVSGMGLADLMRKQYLRLGGEIKEGFVINILKEDELFKIELDSGEFLTAKTIIAATGLRRRKLQVTNEDKFYGKGVSYCATCDAAFFRNKDVAVVGGGDSALTAAIHLSQFAKKLYVIHRRDEFRAKPSLVDKLKGKAEFILNSVIEKFDGDKVLNKIILKDVKTNTTKELVLNGVFVEVGYDPTSGLFEGLGLETLDGFIKVNVDMSTNVKGLFAAGDCTTGLNGMKQIITSAAMGAVACESAYKFIEKI